MRRSRSLALATGFVTFLLAATPAAAQNLLTNPGFDGNANGWQIGSNIYDSTQDAGGNPSSGSVAVSATLGAFSVTNAVNQCVSGIVAGTLYDFGGSLRISQQDVGTTAHVEVAWASDTNCTAFGFPGAFGSNVTTSGSWLASTGNGVAPAGAQSAWISVVPNGGPSGGTINLNADDLFFQADQPVPTLGSASLGVLTAALALAGVWAVRRRSSSPSPLA